MKFNNTLQLWSGSTNAVNITTGGNVGIGTANPATALDAYTGTMNAATVTATSGTFKGAPAAAANVLTVTNTTATGNVAQFSSSAQANALLVMGSGSVGINTSNTSTPYSLEIFASTSIATTGGTIYPCLRLNGNGVGARQTAIDFTTFSNRAAGPSARIAAVDNGGQSSALAFYTAATGGSSTLARGLLIDTNLAVTIDALAGAAGLRYVGTTTAGTLYTTSVTPSDARLKTSRVPIENGLAKVMALNPIYFNWINTSEYGPEREIGFIAQEVLEIVPEVVRFENDFYGIKYEQLTAVLTKAIQELTARLQIAEQEIALLKAR